MTLFVLTATKEYSLDGVNWETVDSPRLIRNANSVSFIPGNNEAPIVITPSVDVLNLDGSASANPYTPLGLVTALKSAFPKGNSSSTQSTGLQTEVDAVEAGAGLSADGTYAPNSFTNYIKTATSLKNADELLDTQIGLNSTRTVLFLGAKTRAARDLLSVPAGSQIFNTDDGYFEYYDSFWGWMPLYISNEWRRHYGVEYFRDFYLNTPDAFLGTITANSAGLNNSAAPTGSTSENGGTVNLTMQTTATARAGFTSGTGVVLLGSGITVFETKIQIPVLSNSTDRFQFYAGLMDNPNGVDQVDGVYFLYDEGGVSLGSVASANWQMVTSSNSSRTFAQGSAPVPVVANTWYTLRTEVNAAGTLASYYINGTLLGTIATTIPTGLSRATGIGVFAQKSIGATNNRNVSLNYIFYKQKFTTPR